MQTGEASISHFQRSTWNAWIQRTQGCQHDDALFCCLLDGRATASPCQQVKTAAGKKLDIFSSQGKRTGSPSRMRTAHERLGERISSSKLTTTSSTPRVAPAKAEVCSTSRGTQQEAFEDAPIYTCRYAILHWTQDLPWSKV